MNGRPRPSLRQLRLAAWMRDPKATSLPDIEKYGFNWRNNYWKAADLVTHAGIYGPDEHGACLRDLAALARSGIVERVGEGTSRRFRAYGDGE